MILFFKEVFILVDKRSMEIGSCPMLYFMSCMIPCMGYTQLINGEYISEWKWNMKKQTG